jgi:hypothetical protein
MFYTVCFSRAVFFVCGKIKNISFLCTEKRGKTLQRRNDRQKESRSIETWNDSYDAEETRLLPHINMNGQKGYS